MFARIGSVFCPDHNIKLERKSFTDIYNHVKKNYSEKDMKIIANLGQFKKADAKEICSKYERPVANWKEARKILNIPLKINN